VNAISRIGSTEPLVSARDKVEVFDAAKAAEPQETVEILVDAGLVKPKSWWTSSGIYGSLGALSGSLAMIVAAIAKAVGYEVDIQATELLIGAFLGLAVAVATWWGRVHAAQPISTTQVLPGLTLKGQP
jgi:hypothetical protein